MLLDETLRTRIHEALAGFVRLQAAAGPQHPAAVALTLIEEGTGAQLDHVQAPAGWSRNAAILLTRRAADLRAHAGQWALPAGAQPASVHKSTWFGGLYQKLVLVK